MSTNLQRHGVAATAKHYVANDAETHRFSVDVRVDEQTLREVYLAPFEQLVTSAGVWVVMAAYNSVNGATMTENPLLTAPLIEEWGFDGVVVSDWYATRSTESSARGGLTLVMPGPEGPWGPALLAAVTAGRVAEASITDKVRRILRLAVRVGALTPQHPADRSSAAAQPREPGPTERICRGSCGRRRPPASCWRATPGCCRSIRSSCGGSPCSGRTPRTTPVQGGGSCEVVPPYSSVRPRGVEDGARARRFASSMRWARPSARASGRSRRRMATCVSCGRAGRTCSLSGSRGSGDPQRAPPGRPARLVR